MKRWRCFATSWSYFLTKRKFMDSPPFFYYSLAFGLLFGRNMGSTSNVMFFWNDVCLFESERRNVGNHFCFFYQGGGGGSKTEQLLANRENAIPHVGLYPVEYVFIYIFFTVFYVYLVDLWCDASSYDIIGPGCVYFIACVSLLSWWNAKTPFFFVCVLFTDTQYIQHLSDNILYKFEKEKEKIQMTTIFF